MTATSQGAPLVLVLDDDLLFSTRVEKGLLKLGYGARVLTSAAEALDTAAREAPVLVILNYAKDALAPAETTRKLKDLPHPPRVMGYISHSWIPQVRPNAMAAGCDLLVANSALALKLPQLVTKLAPRDGSTPDAAAAALHADEEENAED